MSVDTPVAPSTSELHPAFVERMVRTFNDPDRHGVHFLFNEWWAHAPEQAIHAYVEILRSAPGAEEYLAARFLADPIELASLAAMAEGSVGHCYHDFLVDNGLEKNLATNYRMLHEAMAASGQLDRMPEELKYAVIRGFQIHDLLHVITGYSPSALDELALQAFCLAQIPFPYFGMWMATTTTRMTFLLPRAIVPVMEAITGGWRYGRMVRNLQFERWESMLSEPLAEVRARFGVATGGRGVG